MPLRWLFRRFVHNAAKAKAAETVRRAASAASSPSDAAPQQAEPSEDDHCRAAVLFDLPVELEAFLPRLRGVVTNRAAGLDVHVGGLAGKRIAAAVQSEDPDSAARSVATLAAGHQPALIVAAGQACGLIDSVRVGDVLLASEVVDDRGGHFSIEMNADPDEHVHVARLVSLAELPSTPAAKRELAQQSSSSAVDRTSFAAGNACRQAGVPFLAVRVIREAVDDVLPRDVEHLLAQESIIGKAGAFTGALWRRPGSFKDLWRLKERSITAADRLSALLTRLLS